MKRKFVALMVVIVLSLTSLTACGAKTPQDIVSEALGLDASGGSEVSASDTHGGFHGDGTSCIVLTFQDDAVLEQIKANADWNSLPWTRLLKSSCTAFPERRITRPIKSVPI